MPLPRGSLPATRRRSAPLDAWLPDEVMQAIAMENNLSETAFFVKNGDGFDLRWFTSAHEVDLCGHATLGTAYIIASQLEPGCDEVRFQSRSGPLTVRRDGELYTLDFPACHPSALRTMQRLWMPWAPHPQNCGTKWT